VRRAAARRTVLVVDDSALMRRVVRDLLEGTEFTVVGTARDGRDALNKLHLLEPDLVTLDVEMPRLGGLDVLGYVMSEAPRPVVMLSAYTTAGAEASLRALDMGAVDIVAKPGSRDAGDLEALGRRLLLALRAAARAELANVGTAEVRPPRDTSAHTAPAAGRGAEVVVALAASTGGPRALLELIPRLPASLEAAVVVVQHMPPDFTRSLAVRLDALGPLPACEAADGVALEPGRVYVAPGDFHTRVRRESGGVASFTLSRGAPVWGVRPSADPLFVSVAEAFGTAAVGVVLTGMGRDGADGLQAIRAAGGLTAAQDRATSVVFGMPRAAAPAAGSVLPLLEVSGWIHAAVVSVRPGGRPVHFPIPEVPRAQPIGQLQEDA
jgi:two-component system, chemotaxis family, protein-glutamate methylesterase/glutaminase